MYALEKNGPLVAAEIRAWALAGKYTVVALTYNRTGMLVWHHRTLKAALRRLGSACSGKLRPGGCFAAAIVTPESRVLSWSEGKAALLA